MKLQNLTVIFIIIMVPIILLVSLYISTGLKTIKYQSLYDNGLITATHDALYAFELNTTNDIYSDNAETKRNILKSSVKMFEKSLCNTCGISSYNTDEIEEYVPAIVFGLYDGFYMYAPSELDGEYKHNLKNYVYYSEKLPDGTVIRYSLDNYVTVCGNFGEDGAYTIEEGYLMDLNGSNLNGTQYKGITINQETINGVANTEGINYYKEAYAFTKWFNEKIANNNSDPAHDYLQINDNNDPEDENSKFSQHKREIIKNKIENVLNSSITAYAKKTMGSYKMPKLSEQDWEKIFTNISTITFFQGKSIGLTKYNGYCVLNSTNSNEYVNPNLMYFISGNDTTNNYYHDIRCEECETATTLTGYRIGKYEKKKVAEIDESNNITYTYKYSHNALACYRCINGQLNKNITVYDYVRDSGTSNNIKESYFTSLGRERYNQTKLTESESIKNIEAINVEIKWEDEAGNDLGNSETPNINLNLLKNGTKERDIEVTQAQGWKTTIENLNVYTEETAVTYGITPDNNIINDKWKYDGITTSGNNFTVIYKKIPLISQIIEIEFEDTDNQDGIRPTSVNVQLLKDGIESYSVTLNSSNDWKYEWTNLQQLENGVDISYSINTSDIESYNKEINVNNNKTTVKYKHSPELVTIFMAVEYDDYDNMDILRPEAVDVYLNGITYTLSKNASDSDNDFKKTLSLPKYENGSEINYAVTCNNINNYTCNITRQDIEATETKYATYAYTIKYTYNKRYLYKNGNEYTDKTGGWYASIVSDWYFTKDLYEGAFYSKETSYLCFGDDKDSDWGNGAFVTLNKINNISNYSKLYVEFKVTESTEAFSYPNVVNITFAENRPGIIQYIDENRSTYKKIDVSNTFNEVKYEDLQSEFGFGEYTTSDHSRSIFTQCSPIATSTVWSSQGDDVEIAKSTNTNYKVEISFTKDGKKWLNEDCYLLLYSNSHAYKEGTMKVEVYSMYLE